MAILFISHDLDVIGEMADEVMVMRQGRVIESGPADTVLRNPSHAYTRSMLHIQPGGRAPGRAPDDGQPLLEVHELKLGFASVGRRPGIRALDGVSLRVYPGETLGLAGESGCGKSTLCRSILRLAEPGSGSVRFRGEEVTTMESPSLRRFRTQVQIVFQDPYSSLNPRMTVADILAEPMRVHGLYGRTESQRRAGALLESVGLDHGYGSRYPHELSAGQRQRVCIARALAVDPALIICDEPVSSLDTPARAQVLALLQKLKEERKLSLVFVSHDLSVIRHISDRVAVMHEGRIVETDTPEALFENPVSEHTIKLIDAIPASVRSSLSAYSS
jgi:peptide/nickel transport system ATP-binding protein